MAQTVIIRGQSQRDLAKSLIDRAPVDAVVTVKEATRNADQNALMWALLSDISRAKPEGRQWVPARALCSHRAVGPRRAAGRHDHARCADRHRIG